MRKIVFLLIALMLSSAVLTGCDDDHRGRGHRGKGGRHHGRR